MLTADAIKDTLNRAARHVFWQALGAGIVSYFVYYAINGDRGFIALSHLQGEIRQAEAVLTQVRLEREYMQHRASLLRPDNLDPDMLDERARRLLNFSRPDEVIILQPRGSVALPVTTGPSSDVTR